MYTRWILLLAATVMSLSGTPSLLWADGGHGSRQWQEGRHGHGMASFHSHTSRYLRHLVRHQQAIGLTDEQVSKLRALRLDFDRTRIRTSAEIAVASLDLRALAQDDKTDLATIESKVKQRGDLASALHIAAIKTKREATSLLTPEQREKAKAEREKMMQYRCGCHMRTPSTHAGLSSEFEAVSSEGRSVQDNDQNLLPALRAGVDGSNGEVADIAALQP